MTAAAPHNNFLDVYVFGVLERVRQLAQTTLPDLPGQDAVYARISDDYEGKEAGVGRQTEDSRSRAQRDGKTIPDACLFIDNDTSAGVSKKVRPAFELMLAYVVQGKVKTVYAYSNSRLTRRTMELEILILCHLQYGLNIITCVSGQDDLSTADGRMVARYKAVADAAEAERAQERIIRQQVQHAKNGNKHQGKHRVYGYDRDFNIVEDEAKAVREAFERKANGESLTSIAYALNQKGYRTAVNVIKSGKNAGKTVGGGTWDSSLVSKMIKRRDYIAEVTRNGEVVAQAKWEPIIDRAVWIKANEEADKNQRRGIGTRTSILAGFLICDNCGYKMKGGGAKNEPRYNCPSPKATNNVSCGSCSIVGPATNEIILFAAFEKMLEKHDEVKPYEPERDWRAEEQAIKDEMDKANGYRRAKQLAMEDFVPLMAELREQLNSLLKEEAETVTVNLGDVASWLELRKMSLSAVRAWLDQHVSYVVVAKAERVGIKGFKPERLTVHFTDGEVRTLDHDYKVFVPAPTLTETEWHEGLRQLGFHEVTDAP